MSEMDRNAVDRERLGPAKIVDLHAWREQKREARDAELRAARDARCPDWLRRELLELRLELTEVAVTVAEQRMRFAEQLRDQELLSEDVRAEVVDAVRAELRQLWPGMERCWRENQARRQSAAAREYSNDARARPAPHPPTRRTARPGVELGRTNEKATPRTR